MTTNVLRYAFAVSAMNTCLLLAFLPTAALAQEPEMAAESTPGPMRAVSRSQGPVRLPEQDVQAFLASPANLLSTTIDKDTLMTQVRALAVSDPDALARLIELVKSASDRKRRQSARVWRGRRRFLRSACLRQIGRRRRPSRRPLPVFKMQPSRRPMKVQSEILKLAPLARRGLLALETLQLVQHLQESLGMAVSALSVQPQFKGRLYSMGPPMALLQLRAEEAPVTSP